MISIIVPVYNLGETYIERCVTSIINQTVEDFELILVDDGSTDNSSIICDRMALRDKRIHSFHKINGGAASARKYGVDKSTGEWIMFVDGDDTVPQDALAKLIKTDYVHNCDIIVGTCNINNQYIYQNLTEKCLLNKYEYIKAILLDKTQIGPWAKLYKKNLFYDVEWITPKEIIQNEDLLMLIALSLNANRIYINQNAVCYNYMFRDESISKQIMPYKIWIKLFRQINKQLLQLPDYNYIKEAFFIYRIKRLYFNNILMGNAFRTKDPYVQSLINESSNYSLSENEQKIVRLLKHGYLRRLKYVSTKTIPKMRNFFKRLFCTNSES